jgi:hypothetical protein
MIVASSSRTLTCIVMNVTVFYLFQREQRPHWGCDRCLYALHQHMRECRPGPGQVRHEPVPGGQSGRSGAALTQTVSKGRLVTNTATVRFSSTV